MGYGDGEVMWVDVDEEIFEDERGRFIWGLMLKVNREN